MLGRVVVGPASGGVVDGVALYRRKGRSRRSSCGRHTPRHEPATWSGVGGIDLKEDLRVPTFV
jgi:hypothetical protein